MPKQALARFALVFDAVYTPLHTRLLLEAKVRGDRAAAAAGECWKPGGERSREIASWGGRALDSQQAGHPAAALAAWPVQLWKAGQWRASRQTGPAGEFDQIGIRQCSLSTAAGGGVQHCHRRRHVHRPGGRAVPAVHWRLPGGSRDEGSSVVGRVSRQQRGECPRTAGHGSAGAAGARI